MDVEFYDHDHFRGGGRLAVTLTHGFQVDQQTGASIWNVETGKETVRSASLPVGATVEKIIIGLPGISCLYALGTWFFRDADWFFLSI